MSRTSDQSNFKVTDDAAFELEEILGLKFSAGTHTRVRLIFERILLQGETEGFDQAIDIVGKGGWR